MQRLAATLMSVVLVAACAASSIITTSSPGPTSTRTRHRRRLRPKSPVGPSTAPPAGTVQLARSTSREPPRTLPRPSPRPDAINAFGLELYSRLAAEPGNIVISPAGVAIALAMARAGARGETAAEMDAVLGAVASDEHAGWLNALDAALAGRSGTFPDAADKPYPVALRIANAPFAQRGMTLVPAYLDALASRFGAGLRLVDYRADPEAARRLINGWVDEQTEDRVPSILNPATSRKRGAWPWPTPST